MVFNFLQFQLVVSDMVQTGNKKYILNMIVGDVKPTLREGTVDAVAILHRFFSFDIPT